MPIDAAAPRSRRAMLVAGLGGVVAAVASTLGRPDLVGATDLQPILAAAVNTEGVWTELHNTNANPAAAGGLVVTAAGPGIGIDGSSDSGYGIHGSSSSNAAIYGESTSHPGVIGHSDNTIGVSGISPNGSGVSGSSGIGVGVVGTSNATNQAGIRGSSGGDATGVLGYSGSSLPATAPAKTGVYGEAAQDSTAKGLWGKSGSGRGVYGQAGGGHGVHGYATTGSAVYAQTAGLKKGLAIHSIGRVKFDNCSGIATIASGTKSVVVTPGIDLQSTSAVVATLQGNPGGTTAVQRVEVNATADTFTIFLTANATSTVSVAWHVFG